MYLDSRPREPVPKGEFSFEKTNPQELRAYYQSFVASKAPLLSNDCHVGVLGGRIVEIDSHIISDICTVFDSAAYYDVLKRKKDGRAAKIVLPKVHPHIKCQKLFPWRYARDGSFRHSFFNRLTDEDLQIGMKAVSLTRQKREELPSLCKARQLDPKKHMPSTGYMIHHALLAILKQRDPHVFREAVHSTSSASPIKARDASPSSKKQDDGDSASDPLISYPSPSRTRRPYLLKKGAARISPSVVSQTPVREESIIVDEIDKAIHHALQEAEKEKGQSRCVIL